jgi:ATP-binding cassette subfamily B protein
VLFNDTILYNIGYGGVNNPNIKKLLSDPNREEELINLITPSAKRSQIHDFVIGKSKGYLEKVGERGLKLSGGEKQRVAIARALLKNTAIMCFDEATSALDTVTEQEIQKSIEEVSKHCTTLMIAHRLSTVKNCDLIIVLKHGEIIEQGTHEGLLSEPEGYYRTLWEKQSELLEKEREDRARKEQIERELKLALEKSGST